jgi:hypothetical protein
LLLCLDFWVVIGIDWDSRRAHPPSISPTQTKNTPPLQKKQATGFDDQNLQHVVPAVRSAVEDRSWRVRQAIAKVKKNTRRVYVCFFFFLNMGWYVWMDLARRCVCWAVCSLVRPAGDCQGNRNEGRKGWWVG